MGEAGRVNPAKRLLFSFAPLARRVLPRPAQRFLLLKPEMPTDDLGLTVDGEVPSVQRQLITQMTTLEILDRLGIGIHDKVLNKSFF